MKFKITKGMALISVLMLSVIMTMLTITIVFLSTNHLQLIGNVEYKTKSLKIAEGMAEYALSKLNDDRTWGLYDSNGTLLPDPNDSVTIPFEGGTGKIEFGQNKGYLSYNNLMGASPVNRLAIGDMKLTGKIAAYSAEIICQGKVGNITKYVKVIFIRNDVYPYNMNSYGRVVFKAGLINIFGPMDDMPGRIHSTWEDGTNPSIATDGANCKVDAYSGIASASGPISITQKSTDAVTIMDNLGIKGKEQFEEINPDTIINNGKGSAQRVEPGAFLITNLYYIPNNPSVALAILNNAQSVSSEKYKNQLKDKDGAIADTGWAGPTYTDISASPVYSEMSYSNVVVSTTNSSWDGVGGNTVRAGNCSIGVTWNVNATEHYQEKVEDGEDANGVMQYHYEERTRPVSKSISDIENSPLVDEGDRTYSMELSQSWGDKGPPAPVKNVLGDDNDYYKIGMGRLSGDDSMAKFIAPGKTDSELGMNLSVTEENNKLVAKINLTSDIYISNSDGTTRPMADDYKKSLNDIVSDGYSNHNRFMLKRDNPTINGREYLMDIILELNDKDGNQRNIYSDGHLVLGAQVCGKGCMVSRGKLAYLYGITSEEMFAIAQDDLIIQTSGTRKDYNMNGVFYSNDDVAIRPLDVAGPLSGGADNKVKHYQFDSDIKSGVNKVTFTGSANGQYVPMFKENPSPGKYKYTIPKGTKFTYNEGTEYTLGDAQLIIDYDGTTTTAKLYKYDSTTKKYVEAALASPYISPSIDQTTLNNIAGILRYDYDHSDADTLKIAGTVTGLNKHKFGDDWYDGFTQEGGDNSITVSGSDTTTTTFNYAMKGLKKLSILRGEDFHVRRTSWIVLN